jgi:hypothetical protein
MWFQEDLVIRARSGVRQYLRRSFDGFHGELAAKNYLNCAAGIALHPAQLASNY